MWRYILWCNIQTSCLHKYYTIYCNFANPLDTADTNNIDKKNTTINYKVCKLWEAIRPGRSDGICGVCTFSPPRIYWFLSKTHENHYFLFRYDTTSEIGDLTVQSKTTAKIICIIQTDGYLDFSEAFKSPAIYSSEKLNHTINQPHSSIRKVLTSEIASQNGVLYNIQEKIIDKSVARTDHANAIRLFIISNK